MTGLTESSFTAMVSFLLMLLMGPVVIPMLARFKFGQTVRDDGPQSHLAKNGTPTMGGVMILIAIVISVIIRHGLSADTSIGLLCIFGFGFVGFLDDFIKIKLNRSLGLRAWQKIVLQFALAFLVAWLRYRSSVNASQLIVPFTDYIINLGVLYIPIMMFIIIGTVNAVNLTDGLDGLASGVTAIVCVFYIIYSVFGQVNPDVSALASATLGACLGFLCFNSYPAKVFMGDTGSMGLGGAVVAFAIFTNTALIIPFVGGIYFAEALSVIIQVGYFKKTRKRIFKMAPLHHHFEQCGWSETHVAAAFMITTCFLVWISIIGLM